MEQFISFSTKYYSLHMFSQFRIEIFFHGKTKLVIEFTPLLKVAAMVEYH